MSSNNQSLAMQRIAKLVDENSFMEIGSLVTARSTDFNLTAAKAPSDGVIIGHGLIDGNLVFIYSQDATVLNGTIGEMHAKKIASVYDMAMKMGAPVIGFIDCGGIRLQESVDPFFFFFLAVPEACGSSKVQGSNPHHRSNQSCCSDNGRSLIHCTTRELPVNLHCT